MKFTAKILDGFYMDSLARIVGMFYKLSKKCVMRVSPDRLCFCSTDASKLWIEVRQSAYFEVFQFKGLSEEYNEIVFQCSSEELFRALKTTCGPQNEKQMKLKLTKPNAEVFLSVEIQLGFSLASAAPRILSHNIPVSILQPKMWPEYREPEMPAFDVSIYLPQIKSLHKIVMGMKGLGGHIKLSANHRGLFSLKVESQIVSVRTHFKDLTHPIWGDENGIDPVEMNPNKFSSARIDIRTLASFINAYQASPVGVGASFICNIVNGRMVQLYMSAEDDTILQFFIPAVAV